MDHDDFDQEPIRGLPETLPPGERILWQGAPSARALARDALRARWVAGYFAVLFAWRAMANAAGMPPAQAAGEAAFLLVLGAGAVGLLCAVAWCQARATVYTITDRRVVMRIGAALTMTLQFPHRWIAAADLALARDGTGTIALRTAGATRFSYLVLWPHARPWRANPAQPALRAVPDAARVARLLAEAVAAHGPVRAAIPDAPARPATAGGHPVPAE